MNAHVVLTKGSGSGWVNPFVAYCLDCRWTCAGYPPAVREAARKHERQVARAFAEAPVPEVEKP